MPIPKRLREDISDKEFADAYVDEFLNVSIATQLKVLREQRKYTQKRLAELAGMKQERISVLENVNYSSWSINTLRKLAAALDVTLRVSFETFGSCISDMGKLTRESLERMSREDELALDKKIESAHQAANMLANYYDHRTPANTQEPGAILPGAGSPPGIRYSTAAAQPPILIPGQK